MPELKANVERLSQTLEGAYSDTSLCQVLPAASPPLKLATSLPSALPPSGALPAPRRAGPRGPGLGGTLLGLHLRPRPPALDEVQRHQHQRVLVGGAGAGLLRGDDQRQRLLPDVHRRPASASHHRLVQVYWVRVCVPAVVESRLVFVVQTTRTTRRARFCTDWTPCLRSSDATWVRTTAGSSRSSVSGRSRSARPLRLRASPHPRPRRSPPSPVQSSSPRRWWNQHRSQVPSPKRWSRGLLQSQNQSQKWGTKRNAERRRRRRRKVCPGYWFLFQKTQFVLMKQNLNNFVSFISFGGFLLNVFDSRLSRVSRTPADPALLAMVPRVRTSAASLLPR